MTQTHSNLDTLVAGYDGILLDAYGVFWGGNEVGLYPGAKEMMRELVIKGKVVGILSNTTQLSPKELLKYEKHGLIVDEHFHFLITSGDIVRKSLLQMDLPFKTPRNTYWLFGGPHPKYSSHLPVLSETIYRETSDVDEADFIYISIPHLNGEDQTDPQVFKAALVNIIEKRLPMLCPNPDLFAHEGSPPKAVVRQGSIAKLYQELGGEVFYFGKPNPGAFMEAIEAFIKRGVASASSVLMIGDTPETDIRGAKSCKIASALVTKTGVMGDRVVIDGIDRAFKSLLSTDIPEFMIERFQQPFQLHPNLQTKAYIADLPLCRVLLEDEKNYPWCLLVPRRQGAKRMTDLSPSEQQQLMKELDFVQRIFLEEFKPTQLNVAAIGNKTPQLHVHVIARFENDPAWPYTVWDHSERSKYQGGKKENILLKLKTHFKCMCADFR